MMAIIAALLVVTLPLCTAVFVFFGLRWFVRKLRGQWGDWNWAKRFGFLGAGLLLVAAPYLAFKVWEYRQVLARVPYPLQAYWIDYRNEVSGGIGLPGDNETGFVVYSLTARSMKWAKNNAATLDDLLPGRTEEWKRTPVDDWADGGARWHSHGKNDSTPGHAADIKEYLGLYGFGIQIDQGQIDNVNRVIRTPGSFYEYGVGGSVTIVDPKHGKVYFAYAG